MRPDALHHRGRRQQEIDAQSLAAMECAAMLRPSQPEPVLTRYAIGMLGKSQTLSIAAARHDLGYNPAIPVSEGIDRTIAAWRVAHA